MLPVTGKVPADQNGAIPAACAALIADCGLPETSSPNQSGATTTTSQTSATSTASASNTYGPDRVARAYRHHRDRSASRGGVSRCGDHARLRQWRGMQNPKASCPVDQAEGGDNTFVCTMASPTNGNGLQAGSQVNGDASVTHVPAGS